MGFLKNLTNSSVKKPREQSNPPPDPKRVKPSNPTPTFYVPITTPSKPSYFPQPEPVGFPPKLVDSTPTPIATSTASNSSLSTTSAVTLAAAAAAAAAAAPNYVPPFAAQMFGESKVSPRIQEHPCPQCDKVFGFVRSLRVHIETFHQKPVFSCTLCNKVYQHTSSLNAHVLEAHTQMSFTCTFPGCYKVFDSARFLKQHERMHLPGTFVCPTCNARFKTRQNLNGHMLIHSGEKPHQCTVCQKSFRRSDQLRTHERGLAHRRRAMVGTEGGSVGGASVPSGFACKHCGKRFAKNVLCTEHERIHTGETPFSCEVCGAAFRTKRTLMRHSAKHGDDDSSESEEN